MNKKALFISGLVGIVAVGSSFGAYSALHGTDDPIDTGANFEVPEPGNDANQTRLATDKSPYPDHLIGGDAVDPSLGVPNRGPESSPTFEDWSRWKAGELASLDEIIMTDDPVSTNDEPGELSLGVPAPGFEASVDFASISTLECLFDGATSLGLDFSSVFQIAPTGFEPPAEYLQVASDCGFPITDEPTSSEPSPPQMEPIPAGELASLGEVIMTDGPVSTNDDPGELSLGVPAPGFEASVDELIVPVEVYEPRSDDGQVSDLDERYN